MDFITDLPLTIQLSVKILLIITDRLSKRVIFIPILFIYTPAVTTAFIKYYTPYHGFPKGIINNRET